MLMFGKQLTAEQRLQRAVVAIMNSSRYAPLSGVLMIGKREIVEELPFPFPQTACTNGVNEKYVRSFVDTLNDAELRYLVLHETYHKLYKHLTTWQHLHKKDPQVINMATDHHINLKLNDENQDGFAVMPKDKEGKPGGLADVQYTGMDSGTIFWKILKEQENGGGKGKGQGGGFDEHDWDAAEAMSDEEKQDIARQVDSALRQGCMAAGKNKGSGDRLFDELLEPQVDWKEVVREFATQLCAGKDFSTWRRPNRRHVANGLYLPSGLTERIGELLLAVDTSGSISNELKQFLGEIKFICENIKLEQLRLVYWGSEVVQDEVYKAHEIGNLINSTQPKDGGGTSPSCIPQYMRETGIKPQAVIVFTDGYVGSDWGGHWDVPVLWCIVGNKSAAPTSGKVVYVE